MSADNDQSKSQGACLLDCIQDFKNGKIHPSSLEIETKIQLTELLRRDGCTISQIAQILKTSDRTIKRYVKIIKNRNKINRNPEFVAEYAGEMLAGAEYGINRLIRLATGKDLKGAEKIQAESAAWHIRERLTKLLQSMGHLDSESQNLAKDTSNRKETDSPPVINILPVSAKPKEASENDKPS